MHPPYNPQEIEPRIQAGWEASGALRAPDGPERPKYYLLEMFPYPSGRIHMGHVRNYSIGDVLARFRRMQGYAVLHPMGWDAFGLPAENAAIKHRVHPEAWTRQNIAHMKSQLRRMGFAYDWSREVTTCDPDYYRWEQKIFLEMYRRGLAYRKSSPVNWCPACSTVLANEQVEDGRCWRCESVVSQRELVQWFFRITAYADELLAGLKDLAGGWPEKVLAMQANWIGRSEGARIVFSFEHSGAPVEVFTTRPDTLCGATFLSLAAEHPIVPELCRGLPEERTVLDFCTRMKAEGRDARTADDREKEGVFTGRFVINPLTGRRMPVWVANFVLMEYGTGAVMAVPAHDERDFDFATKYGLGIVEVILPPGQDGPSVRLERAYVEAGTLVNSGRYDGMPSESAKAAIVGQLRSEGRGDATVHWRLRDWGVSRQRYWGTPIPVVHCDRCGIVPVPESDLPVRLPLDVTVAEMNRSPLVDHPGFVRTACPDCGGDARRETDTFDTFVESSWYFFRYCSPGAVDGPFVREDQARWMPVDQYIGGVEHAVMHLLYARFFTRVLRDLGYTGLSEPFSRLLTQGMVCMETLRCPEHGFLDPSEATAERTCRSCGRPVEVGRVEKMSKSKKNVVDPEGLIARYGADTARVFSLFAAPPERDLEWSESGVEGASRFLNRVWRLVHGNLELLRAAPDRYDPAEVSVQADRDLRRATHTAIRRVTEDIADRMHLNTAIAAIMELVNALHLVRPEERPLSRALFREGVETAVVLLSPFAPHISDELWVALGGSGSLIGHAWPGYDPAALSRATVTIAVQVNGRLRAEIEVLVDAEREEIERAALAHERTRRFTEGLTVVKVVYVPGKLVSVVAR